LIAWLSVAFASPEAGVQIVVAAPRDEQDRAAAVALGLWGALPITGRFHLDARAFGGPLLTGGALATGTGGLRAFLTPTDGPTVSLAAGGGITLEEGLRPAILAGLAVDPGRSPDPRARLEVGYLWGPDDTGRLIVTVGALFGRQGTAPTAADLPEPAPIPVMPEGMIWLPGPVCQWLPPDEATVEVLRSGLRLASYSVVSERTLRGDAPDPDAPPPQGRVLIAASARDRVSVDGEPLDVIDGVATWRRSAGRADVRVVGGGRSLDLPVGVEDGHAVWLAVDPPPTTRILFPLGSGSLDASARARIVEIAAAAGDWSFELVGSASPEGDPVANDALGRRRALAVRDALVAAGVPAERLRVGPPAPPAPDLPPTEQRNALIVPLETP
jgi:hypothetical protein